jgi:hypothetical protein
VCGLVGSNFGTISNAYATGSVSGYGGVFGLVGHYGTVTNSFWDIESSGTEESVGGTGKTTAEMKTRATFVDAGWDFDNTWAMNQINDGYPFLRWQLENR